MIHTVLAVIRDDVLCTEVRVRNPDQIQLNGTSSGREKIGVRPSGRAQRLEESRHFMLLIATKPPAVFLLVVRLN